MLRSSTFCPIWISLVALLLLQRTRRLHANPHSRPYVPYRTSPFEQHLLLHHNITLDGEVEKSKVHEYSQKESQGKQCPLQFTLGLSRRSHVQHTGALAIVSPPIIYPVHPSRGPGRQVLHTTQYEHLDLLSPSRIPLDSVVQEGLVQQEDFPLLFESSSFLASPIVHDVNSDGIPDAILADYDGGLYFVGLTVKDGTQRFLQRAQVPRMYLRRDWLVTRLNETLYGPREVTDNENDIYDPFHSHFEYGDDRHVGDAVLQGVPADVLRHDSEDLKGLDQRRNRRVKRGKTVVLEEPENGQDDQVEGTGQQQFEVDSEHSLENEAEQHGLILEHGEREEREHRRLQEADVDPVKEAIAQEQDVFKEEALTELVDSEIDKRDHDTDEVNPIHEEQKDHVSRDDGIADQDIDVSVMDEMREDDWEAIRGGEEGMPAIDDTNDDTVMGEDYNGDYPMGYDDYYYGQYKRNEVHDTYYDDANYIRIPPHLLCSPVLMELPRLYAPNDYEVEDLLFVAVSYYMDEDEYEGFFSYKRFENVDIGDESEVQRGFFVASALMVYHLGKSPRWGRQEHLDLSADPTAPQNLTLVGSYPIVAHDEKMGAFALSSPTIADIDGDGSYEVFIATSMGIVYCFDARHMYKKDGWPVQMKGPVESRILVEDVVGDTNLELFVADVHGNTACFDHKGSVIWHRDLKGSIYAEGHDVVASSPMTLGDVNGDGVLDVVLVLSISNEEHDLLFIVALDAATGKDLQNFPISMGTVDLDDSSDQAVETELHIVLPQPLLIDLHSDQTHWKSYLLRNGTRAMSKTVPRARPPHGGSATGLHIIQPVGSELVIIEAGSGCVQKIDIGDEITTMVQSDDVHGSNRLDLVVSTATGNIVTLESPAVPYHPLNVWNNGETRGRMNSFAQGFSASQGIFVHDVSRQYRDIFGVYVPVTFQIFDNRPNIQDEPEKRIYNVEIRDGTSGERALFRANYNQTGIYTELMYVSYGPGYYTFSVVMRTSHGLIYEDTMHVGYNVHYMDGFGLLLWLPLLLAAIPIVVCGKKKRSWEDDYAEADERGGRGLGILGRAVI